METSTIVWDTYRSFGTTPTARSALRISLALLELVDPSMKGAVARNAARLEAHCARLRAAMDRRGASAGAGVDGRPVDLRADRAWGALEMRLRAWVALAVTLGDDHEKVARAVELLAALFAEGTEFLKLPYAEQEVEMDRLLRLADQESLERDLVALAGHEFFEAVKTVQPDYAQMVSSMLARDEQKERIVTLVRDVTRAAESYAGSVLGTVDEEDPKSVALVRALLAPLANHRAAVATRDEQKERDEPSADPNAKKSEDPKPKPPSA